MGRPLRIEAAVHDALDARAGTVPVDELPDLELALAVEDRDLDGGQRPHDLRSVLEQQIEVHRLAERDGAFRRGILLEARLIDPLPMMAAAGASVLWQAQAYIDRALVEELHRAGRRIIAWTANTDADITRLIAAGVDGICSDYPERVVALRN